MRVTRPNASALSPCALVSCFRIPARRSRQARAWLGFGFGFGFGFGLRVTGSS